jgi:Insertion domain in 60S ribosomal protein L10P
VLRFLQYPRRRLLRRAAAPNLVATVSSCVLYSSTLRGPWLKGDFASHSAELCLCMQALNIPTKINKGTVEITTDVQLIRIGEKVRLRVCLFTDP